MKAKVISTGDVWGTRVVREDGVEIENITAVHWEHAQPGAVPRLSVDLAMAEIEAEGELSVYVGGKEVRRIIYADGSAEDFPLLRAALA